MSEPLLRDDDDTQGGPGKGWPLVVDEGGYLVVNTRHPRYAELVDVIGRTAPSHPDPHGTRQAREDDMSERAWLKPLATREWSLLAVFLVPESYDGPTLPILVDGRDNPTPRIRQPGTYRVRWPDQSEETVAVEIETRATVEHDMGHQYAAQTRVPVIVTAHRGAPLRLHLHTVKGLRVLWPPEPPPLPPQDPADAADRLGRRMGV